MMRIGQYEPFEVWGLESCGAYLVPISSFGKEQGVATRARTPLGRGAAHSRSNVAEHIPFGNGGHLRPLKGKYYDRRKLSSTATAPSLGGLGETIVQNNCPSLPTDVIFTLDIQLEMSATSKKAVLRS